MWRRNTVETMRSVAGEGQSGRDQVARRARVGVESLEGRRMMDASSAAGLVLTAQVDAQAAASGCAAVVAGYTRASDQLISQTQQSFGALASSAGQLQAFISQETALVQQAGQVAGSTAATLEANMLAQAKAELRGVQQAEASVIQAFLGTEAWLKQQESAGIQLCVQAGLQARAEAGAATSGAVQTAGVLHAQVGAELAATGQFVNSTRAVAGAVVQAVGQSAGALVAQVGRELAAFDQVMAGLKVSLGGSAGASGQGGLSLGASSRTPSGGR